MDNGDRNLEIKYILIQMFSHETSSIGQGNLRT